MPYTKDSPNLPDHVKKMPAYAQEIWVSTFNSVLRDSGDEGKAFAIANAAAKKAIKRSKAAPSSGLDEADEEVSMSEKDETIIVAAQPGESDAAPVVAEAPLVKQDAGPATQNITTPEPKDEDEGWNSAEPVALCAKCKKKVAIIEGKKGFVGKRVVVTGKCKECGSKVSYMLPEKGEAKESVRSAYVSEAISLREAKVDEAQHLVEVTLIKPGWSANNRFYSPDVLKEAADLFTNCKAYADHPRRSDDADRPERSVRDIVGYYAKTWVGDGGAVVGQLKVLGEASQWLWPLITETVSTGVNLVSTSINALGQVREGEVEGRRGNVVQKIVKANSADVVTEAAAGGKFERLLASDCDAFTNDLLASMSYDEWVKSRPDFAIRLREEMKTARKDEADAALAQQLTEAKAERDAALEGIKKWEMDAIAWGKAEGEYKATIAILHEDIDKAVTKATVAAEAEIADLRQKLAAGDAAHRADKLLWEAALPDSMQAGLRDKIVGKTDDEARQVIEEARAEARRLVLKEGTVPVRATPSDGMQQPVNPIASLLGVTVPVAPGETAEQYAARKRMLEAQQRG